MYLPRMLIKPVNTLFSGKKSGFVHIISLTKSAVYGIIILSSLKRGIYDKSRYKELFCKAI